MSCEIAEQARLADARLAVHQDDLARAGGRRGRAGQHPQRTFPADERRQLRERLRRAGLRRGGRPFGLFGREQCRVLAQYRALEFAQPWPWIDAQLAGE